MDNDDPEDAAKPRAKCARQVEEKKVSWKEISRLFPGEKPDTASGPALPALKQLLRSRS